MELRWSAFLLLLLASVLHAQPVHKVALKPGVFPHTPVMAHQARCVALSETYGLLAFGHDRGYADADVSLFKLDAKGTPSPDSIPLRCPVPEHLSNLKKIGNYPTSLAFHPKLPRLYVWQDVNLLWVNSPRHDAEIKDLDHLSIFDLSASPPKLLVQMCRGVDYVYGQNGGALALDAEGELLYVPNQRDLKNAASWRFGRFKLDADGLPDVLGDDQKLPLPKRLKKLAEWNEKKRSTPPEQTPLEYVHVFPQSPFGSAGTLAVLSRDVVLAGGPTGPVNWRPGDKVNTLSGINLKGPNGTLLGLHPKLPAVFAVRGQADSFYRFEQVEGYITGLPHQFQLPEAKLTSAPVVVRDKHLVIGGPQGLYSLYLDEQGVPVKEALWTPVNASPARALVYSPKFDQFYVGVDLSK
jgi:hypothetical protein